MKVYRATRKGYRDPRTGYSHAKKIQGYKKKDTGLYAKGYRTIGQRIQGFKERMQATKPLG